MLKVLNGTAMYTGGGIYVVLGQLSDGNYFIADNWSICVYNEDVRTEDQDYDFVGVNGNWCENHLVEIPVDKQEETTKAVLNFCKKLDDGKADQVGWEDFSNYMKGEVFSYMEETGFDE